MHPGATNSHLKDVICSWRMYCTHCSYILLSALWTKMSQEKSIPFSSVFLLNTCQYSSKYLWKWIFIPKWRSWLQHSPSHCFAFFVSYLLPRVMSSPPNPVSDSVATQKTSTIHHPIIQLFILFSYFLKSPSPSKHSRTYFEKVPKCGIHIFQTGETMTWPLQTCKNDLNRFAT